MDYIIALRRPLILLAVVLAVWVGLQIAAGASVGTALGNCPAFIIAAAFIYGVGRAVVSWWRGRYPQRGW